MFLWSVKNFGLLAVAVSILGGVAVLDLRLEEMEKCLAAKSQYDLAFSKLAEAVPLQQLRAK